MGWNALWRRTRTTVSARRLAGGGAPERERGRARRHGGDDDRGRARRAARPSSGARRPVRRRLRRQRPELGLDPVELLDHGDDLARRRPGFTELAPPLQQLGAPSLECARAILRHVLVNSIAPGGRPDAERRARRARARARRRLRRDQPGARVRRRGRALREPAQRLLAPAASGRVHLAAVRAGGAVRRARRGSRDHERRPQDDSRIGRPAARRLRRARRSGWKRSRERCGRGRSASSARRPTAARSASGLRSDCRSGGSATRSCSCCRRPRPRTRPCRGRSGCAGSGR